MVRYGKSLKWQYRQVRKRPSILKHYNVVVLHSREVPAADGVDIEYDVLYPKEFDEEKDIPDEFEYIDDWVAEELGNPRKWHRVATVEDTDGMIVVFRRRKRR